MNLSQAVHEFISALELTQKQQDDASNQHTYLRNSLSQKLYLEANYNTFITGSYARSTAIRPLKDIDIFCVLKPTPEITPNHPPSTILKLIQSTLESTYVGKVTEAQNRSVNIEFTTTGIAYDVVPAFIDTGSSDEVFIIPDLHTNSWIRSNPKIHKEKSVRANEATQTALKPLTKAIKHWNRNFEKPARLRSFLIEVMAWDILTTPPPSRLEGLITLFQGLSIRIHTPVPEPARLGPHLDADLTPDQRTQAATRFQDAANTLKNAQSLASDGKTEEAHAILYDLFGDPYPQRGKKPSPLPFTSATIPATDAPTSRFG